MTDEPLFQQFQPLEGAQLPILYPNNTYSNTKHFKDCDIKGTRMLRWLGEKSLKRKQMIPKLKVLHLMSPHECLSLFPPKSSKFCQKKQTTKRRTRAPLQSREKFLVGQLWSPLTALLDRTAVSCWVLVVRGKRTLYLYVICLASLGRTISKPIRWRKKLQKS